MSYIERAIANAHYELDTREKANAYLLGMKYLQKHGYWMAMYHVMTIMIYLHKGRNYYHWTFEDIQMTSFWWEVRNVIYKSK